MYTDGVDSYQKSIEYQTLTRQAADQHRLSRRASRQQAATSGVYQIPRQLVIAIIMIVAVVALLTSAQPALAHQNPQLDPGEGTLFQDAMVAFTLGHYYYGVEDYEKALGYFERSIDLLPEIVFEVAPVDYANHYRRLGMTQAVLGDIAGAHDSFERYLVLAGDGADPMIVAVMAAVNA